MVYDQRDNAVIYKSISCCITLVVKLKLQTPAKWKLSEVVFRENRG